MKTFELTPNNGRKSFYGKCFVKETDNNYTLVSYHTEVAWYDKIDKRFTNTKNESELSNTTLSHIKAFQSFLGLPIQTKQELLKN